MGFLLTKLAQRQGRKDVEGEKVEGRERAKDGEPEESRCTSSWPSRWDQSKWEAGTEGRAKGRQGK